MVTLRRYSGERRLHQTRLALRETWALEESRLIKYMRRDAGLRRNRRREECSHAIAVTLFQSIEESDHQWQCYHMSGK